MKMDIVFGPYRTNSSILGQFFFEDVGQFLQSKILAKCFRSIFTTQYFFGGKIIFGRKKIWPEKFGRKNLAEKIWPKKYGGKNMSEKI